MKKNVVLMMNVKLNSSGRYSPSRSLPYQYSMKSWKKWCDANDCELLILDELLFPIEQMGICWQRYFLFDILEANDTNYDQVLMVDSDTIVHPDCPNFFDLTDRKYAGVHNDGSYDWVLRSIENYSKHIFDGFELEWWNYINGGFQIVNSTHKDFFKTITDFYHTNREQLQWMENTYHVGSDQTPMNFLLQKNEIDVKVLPYEFNMQDMTRKEVLTEDLLMTKFGWVYHFNCIPNNHDNQGTLYWMQKTYKHLYGEE